MKNRIVFLLLRAGVFGILFILLHNASASQKEEKTSASKVINMERLFATSVYCRVTANISLTPENNIEVDITRGFYRSDDQPVDERKIKTQGHRLELITFSFDVITVTFNTEKIQQGMEVPPDLKLTFVPNLDQLTEDLYVKLFLNFNYHAFERVESGGLELIIKIEMEEEEEPEEEIIVVEEVTDTVEPVASAPRSRRTVRTPVVTKSENTIALESILSELNVLYSKLFSTATLSAEDAGKYRVELRNLRNSFIELTREDEPDKDFAIAKDEFRLTYDLALELMASFPGIEKDSTDILVIENSQPESANTNTNKPKPGKTTRIIVFTVIGILVIAFLIFKYFKKLKRLIKR